MTDRVQVSFYLFWVYLSLCYLCWKMTSAEVLLVKVIGSLPSLPVHSGAVDVCVFVCVCGMGDVRVCVCVCVQVCVCVD